MTSTGESQQDRPHIILMYPKTGLDIGGHTVAPPHSVLAAAAPVHQAGYRVKIIDMRRNVDWAQTLAESLSSETICIGISCMTGTQIFFALMMADEARRLTDGRVPIVWGGPHATILPEQTLEDDRVDLVVIGEGEFTFLELVRALEHQQPLDGIRGLGFTNGGTIQVNPPREQLDVNELLPVPWDLINVEDYINADSYFLKGSPRTLDIGQTSRGCPYRCGFCCSSSILEKRWRPMKVERALQAIIEPVERFNLTGVWIRDDEFYVDNNRAFTICERLVNGPHDILWYATGARVNEFNRASDEQLDLLKLSGGRIMKFGAESGTDRILDLINKGFHTEATVRANLRCRDHGIVPAFSLIIGFPTETFDEINQTIDFGFRLRKENPAAQLETIATYTAFPRTPMYPLALEHGLRPPERLPGWMDWILDDYDLEGRQIPWFNRRGRRSIGNISYMSILANAVNNIRGGIENRLWSKIFKALSGPLQGYYRFRLRHKRYHFVPEFWFARRLRKKIFYRSSSTIK